MGILCELFVADPADAPLYEDEADDVESAAEFERVQLSGLTQLEFETMWAITEGRPWDAATHALEVVGEPERDAESWLFRFPPAFVTRLANLSAPEVASITVQWARTEEINCAPQEVEHVVRSLVDLAGLAVASKRGLYLWGSL
jgi:hypothetical protein